MLVYLLARWLIKLSTTFDVNFREGVECVTVSDDHDPDPGIFNGIFTTVGQCAWNSLPAEIRAASSLLSFRRQTKAHLFQLSYN